MATERQKQAARRNLEKASQVQSARARGRNIPKQSPGLSAAEENRMSRSEFAFPEERKEPLPMPAMFATPSPASIRSRE
jgi:hypothetical protein